MGGWTPLIKEESPFQMHDPTANKPLTSTDECKINNYQEIVSDAKWASVYTFLNSYILTLV